MSEPETLWAASTASGLQPIFLATISAASLVCSRMNFMAANSARIALRICVALLLDARPPTSYWIWLIHLGVTLSRRMSTFDLPASCVTAPPSPHT